MKSFSPTLCVPVPKKGRSESSWGEGAQQQQHILPQRKGKILTCNDSRPTFSKETKEGVKGEGGGGGGGHRRGEREQKGQNKKKRRENGQTVRNNAHAYYGISNLLHTLPFMPRVRLLFAPFPSHACNSTQILSVSVFLPTNMHSRF